MYIKHLLYPEYSAFFSGSSLGSFAVGISYGTVAYTYPFALYAEVYEELFEFRLFELFLSAVDPYAAKAQRVRSVNSGTW